MSESGGAPQLTRVPPWRRLLTVAVIAGFAYVLLSLGRRVDWPGVFEALGHLEWWQFLVLAVALVFRRHLDAVPLTFYIEGLHPLRALQNDSAATFVSTAAPPPSDMVIRVAMFTSWGIEVSKGLGGSIMAMISFYIGRFLAPLLGVVVLALSVGTYWGDITTAGVNLAIVVGILATLLFVLKGDEPAATTGRMLGRIVGFVKRSVDPERWSASFVEFRRNMAERARFGLPRAIPVMLLMIVSDAVILVLSLRFVDVPAAAVPAVALVGTYLLYFPLTLTPFSGIGIFDAVLIYMMVNSAGEGWEAEIMAGLIVWRVVTIFGPLVMGAIAIAWWKHEGNEVSFRRPRSTPDGE